MDNPDFDIDIIFTVLDDRIKELGENALKELKADKSNTVSSKKKYISSMTAEQYTAAQSFWTRKDETENKMEPADIYTWIDSFLSSHKVLALATGTGDYVRCTPLEYTWHDDALWIFTEGGLKFKALKENKNVAAAVFETNTSFGGLKSLQIEGTAEIVELYSDEYNAAAAFRKIPIETEYCGLF